MTSPAMPVRRASGFTLVELIVVIAVIVVVVALLLPALVSAREKGRRAVCMSNLRQIGVGIISYANDNEGNIPYGPKAPPFTSPADLYPSTGAPTSLISLRTGTPVALGLLLSGPLSTQPRVLFCPSSDQPLDADAELAKVGNTQAQGSYYYRHGGNTALFDNSAAPFKPEHIQLDRLGDNRQGQPIRALALDTEFVCPPDLEVFNVRPRTHHQQHTVNILFSDAHVVSRQNADGRFTVDVRDYSQLSSAFNLILTVFEHADPEH